MYTKDQLASIADMNKATLRAACKAAAVKGYGKMTVAQMRAAVHRHMEREMKEAAKAAPAPKKAPKRGVTTATFPSDALNEAYAPVWDERNGPDDSKPESNNAAPVVVHLIEREVRHGIARPRVGGLCAAVWEALDKMRASGIQPTTKQMRELATANQWNWNNCLIEAGRWRKFNGLARTNSMKVKKQTP